MFRLHSPFPRMSTQRHYSCCAIHGYHLAVFQAFQYAANTHDGREADLARGFPDQAGLVLRVINAEAWAESEDGVLLAKDLGAKGVKRAHGEPGELARNELLHALFHLPGGLVCEGHREDFRLRDSFREQVSDSARDDAGLPRTRPGDDEKGPIDGRYGFCLLVIQPGWDVWLHVEKTSKNGIAVSKVFDT